MNPKKYAVAIKQHGQAMSMTNIVSDVVHDAGTNTLKLYGVQVRGGVGRLTFNMRYVESYSVVEIEE